MTVRRELGLPTEEPEWLDRPAIGRLTISKPATLDAFAAINGDRPYGEQVKPYNFMLVAHTAPFGHPAGVEPTRFQPIAPWSPHPEEWLALPWVNKATGQPVRLTVEGSTGGSRFAGVKTYREIGAGYRIHPEPKSLGSDGLPCSRRTVGLLRRRPVIATRIVHVGKESNELEEMEAGTVHDGDEVLLEYVSPRCDPWERLVRPTLRTFGPRVVAAHAGISLSAVKEQLAGRSRTHPRNERKLRGVAGELAAEALPNGVSRCRGVSWIAALRTYTRIFRLALSEVGAPADRAVHVGDSVQADVGGARAAGIRPLHFDPHGLCARRTTSMPSRSSKWPT